MKLIVQIPCLNEEATLPATIADIPREIPGIDEVELLVIDDGSTDRTIEVARKHGVDHIVRLTNNKGLAAGFQAGLDACIKLGADVIVNTDADNQYRGTDIPKLVAPVLAGDADIVVGDRRVGQIEHFSGAKKALQKLGSWVVRRLSDTEISDATSGFRAYNREAALGLLVVDNFTYTLESLIQAGKMLVAVDQVEIATNPQTRESRLFDSTGAYVRRNALSILRIYARYEPLRAFSGAGLVVAALALLAWLPFLIDWIVNGDGSGHLQSLILGAVLFIAALQLVALGVIGDLLAGQRVMTQRVFERVRRVELALEVPPSHYEPGAPERLMRGLRKAPGAREGAPGEGTSATADYGRTASFLAIGVGLTGVITYVYFFIASHVLSKPDYGQITVLWSAVFITISTLYRPVEQLLSRHISEHLAKGEAIGGTTRNATLIQLGLAAFFAVVALALRGPLQDDLLEGNETLYWVFFGAVLFYAASYFARGFLAGQKRFGLFTALILSESCFRTLFAALVAIGLLSGQSWVAVGIVAAPSLSLLVVPLAFARRARSAPPPPREAEDSAVSMAHGTGFAAAVLVIMFSEQAFLNAGPLIARGLEGAAAAGFIFNVLMLARAPLQLFQAVSTSILPHLTGLHASDEPGSEDEFHRSVRMVLLGIAAFTAVMAVSVLIAGPQLMQLAFSDKFSYERAELLIVAAGTGLYLASVTVNQACVAQGQVRRAAARWLGCAALFIGWNFVPLVADEFHRVEVGFTLTAGVLFGLLYLIYRRPHERPEDVPTPGSPEELELRLAAVDENT